MNQMKNKNRHFFLSDEFMRTVPNGRKIGHFKQKTLGQNLSLCSLSLKAIKNVLSRKQYNKVPVILFVLLFFCLFPLQVHAGWALSGRFVPLSSLTGDCVVDSITVNGVTVNAVYNYPKKMSDPNYLSDPYYSCAALVTRFYSQVYGISVGNLNTTSSVPQIQSGGGSFSAVSSPQVGDIVRVNTSVHWAIVKSVDSNGNVAVIQQNSWYNWVENGVNMDPDNAFKKAYFVDAVNPAEVTFFRWSGMNIQAQVDRGQDGIYCVGETVHITPSLTNLSSYSLKIIRTPTGGDTYVYWEGSISGTQFDLTLTEEGYYACCFTVSYYGQTVESDWVGWIVATPIKAQIDRGPGAVYNLGETVHITPDMTELDSYRLRIIRTPAGGEPYVDTYTYWEGNLQGPQYDLTLTEDGTYACCYIVTAHGSSIESFGGWVGWTVSSLKAQVDRGQNGIYYVGETVQITPDVTNLDNYRLRIIRTPTGGEPYVDTYTYWEGNLQGPQYDLTLTEDGYYACCYLVTSNGQSIESSGGWVGWTVLPREYMPDFLLPTGLTTIYSEAFAGINAEVVLVPDGCVSIASRAFANCPNLRYVIVDDLSKIDIAADALDGTNAEFIEKK